MGKKGGKPDGSQQNKKRKSHEMDNSKNQSTQSSSSNTTIDTDNNVAIETSPVINLHIKKLEAELAETKARLEENRAELFEATVKIESHTKSIDLLSKNNEVLKNILKEERYTSTFIRNQMNDLEQYSRRNNVRVFRVKDEKHEHSDLSEQKVRNILDKELGLKFHPSDFEICHRVGQYREGADRQIIVKFVRRKAKDLVMLNRKKLAGKNISIAEDLTINNVRRLHSVNNLECVEKSWTKDGRIFAKNKQGFIKVVSPLDQLTENLFDEQRDRHTKPHAQQPSAKPTSEVRSSLPKLHPTHSTTPPSSSSAVRGEPEEIANARTDGNGGSSDTGNNRCITSNVSVGDSTKNGDRDKTKNGSTPSQTHVANPGQKTTTDISQNDVRNGDAPGSVMEGGHDQTVANDMTIGPVTSSTPKSDIRSRLMQMADDSGT